MQGSDVRSFASDWEDPYFDDESEKFLDDFIQQLKEEAPEGCILCQLEQFD